jgi:DNA repair protein SbcC/Rad50
LTEPKRQTPILISKKSGKTLNSGLKDAKINSLKGNPVMIPVRLSLSNFMCYGEDVAALDFRAIHTACISGDNGNGKSALVDAVTWALWGQARTRSNDDLVRSGQSEMAVVFDFQLGAALYRVIRRYRRPSGRGRAGKPILEFQIQSDDGFRSLSGDTMSETQQLIRDTLHLDYDTFINSALLLQGHADEFTSATPVRRKEVLTSILGLGYYDGLAEKARGRARTLEAEELGLNGQVTALQGELDARPEYEQELETANAAGERLQAEVGVSREKLDALKKQRGLLEGQRRHLEEIDGIIASRDNDIQRGATQEKTYRERLQKYSSLIGNENVIMAGYGQFTATRDAVREMDKRRLEIASLDEKKHRLEMVIYKAGESLNQEHNQLQRRLAELAGKTGQAWHYRQQQKDLEAGLAELADEEKSLVGLRKKREQNANNIGQGEAVVKNIEREQAELAEKIKLLRDEDVRQCPLCNSELGADHIHLIRAKYEREITDAGDKKDGILADLGSLKQSETRLAREIAALEMRLAEQGKTLQSRHGVIKRRLDEIAEHEQALRIDGDAIIDIENRLSGQDYALAEQAALAELRAQTDRIGYDGKAHEKTRRELEELLHFEAEYSGLEEAKRHYSEAETALKEAGETVARLERDIVADRARREEMAAELSDYDRVVAELRQVEQANGLLERELLDARQGAAAATARLDNCRRLARQQADVGKQIAEVRAQAQLQRELTEAFGKKGVQALLIEIAVPEIESEANRLLQRMTDNRMSVKIETQRATKTGATVETLDILIADEVGTRNYEMFSGGESFRISFAVRIALSRLLAKRAGAPLSTLIIDEGFGTQDRDGIEKLKEAIASIQDDFEKILVITHIDELKDAFPVRIEVTKNEQGAAFRFA